jgi:hypothetical protein
MRTEAKVGFKQHSTVWVWDSTWLPAVVVHRVQTGCLSVKVTHGVTFSFNMANLLLRDPACRGGDMPRCRSFVLQPKEWTHEQGPKVLSFKAEL